VVSCNTSDTFVSVAHTRNSSIVPFSSKDASRDEKELNAQSYSRCCASATDAILDLQCCMDLIPFIVSRFIFRGTCI